MAFRKPASQQPLPADPEHLYRMLAAQNPTAPENLWSHQADVLRSWHQDHRASKDIALELPTGAGKTLVGGLIADFLRLAEGDRAAYLCPTRQLAKQTAERLNGYGIPAVSLTGRVASWSGPDRARYVAGQAVAVTTYFHVFNANPAVDDAQVLILDDAHAAADAVAGPWSLTIARTAHPVAYKAVLEAVASSLDPLVVVKLREDTDDPKYRNTTYFASPAGMRAAAPQLGQILREMEATGDLPLDAVYALRLIGDHLDGCLAYLSHHQILLRPLIPPTTSHAAFDQPTRRVYMSATLGAGGELERAFGRRKVDRIPMPAGWEKQGTGRRLFVVPGLTTDLAGDPAKAAAWVQSEITRHGRAVLLSPDRRTADIISAQVIPAGTPVLNAEDVEEDLTAFTKLPRAVLKLTNRYDGIDLPNDDCRLVIINELPAHGDLQERFLYSSLGAHEVLQERIRARFAQGAGRATRNARDYATVIVLGQNLITFTTRADVRAAMHPEIHAELEFGWANSIDTTSTEVSTNIGLFLQRGEEWRAAEVDLAVERDLLVRKDPAGTAELQASARHEVKAWQALWDGDVQTAVEEARKALDALRGGQAPQRYAALWNYLAACWTARLAETRAGLDATIDGYYRAARAAGRGTTWLAHLASPADQRPSLHADELDPIDTAAAEGILMSLPSHGKPAKFALFSQAMQSNLKGTEAKAFEEGLVALGVMLGAESEGNGNNDSAPDALWYFGDHMWVSSEAKSEASPSGEVGAVSSRQAGSHLRFASSQRGAPIPSGSIGLLISPEARVHPSAANVAEPHLYLVRPAEVQELAKRAVSVWETLRATPGLTTASVAQEMRSARLLPSQWVVELTTDPLCDHTAVV